jgi:serine/threonine protein phosphatase PrpC
MTLLSFTLNCTLYVGVFDGHGGAKVSKYIKQTLYSNFLRFLPENKSDWNDSIIYSGLGNAVKKVDFEVSKVKNWNRQGSTLSAIYINKIQAKNSNHRDGNGDGDCNGVVSADDNIDNVDTLRDRTPHTNTNNIIENQRKIEESEMENDYSILTVNVGDSRIVLARGRKAIDLTCDHKPNMR